MLLAMTLTLCASLKRGYAVRTPHLLLSSRLVVITLSTLLGVTVVVVVPAFSSDLHSISTNPNVGLHHPSSVLISNYDVVQFLLRHVCSLSIDRHRRRNSQPFVIFLTEFRDLVERVAMESGIIILGDFNVAYGDNNDAHARALRDILSDASLRQNVTDATHQQGNVLDLVITASSSSPITQTSVDAFITDHFAILCDIVLIKPRPLRKHITYRRYGSIDNYSFTKICECARL